VILKGATVKRVVVENNVAVGIEPAEDESTRTALQKANIQVNGQGYIPFDRIYSSAPSFATLKFVNELPADYVAKMNEAKYMGAVLLILKLKQQMTPWYWLNIADRSMPFVATIEQTNFIPPEVYNNKRIMYVSNYLDASSPYFQMSRDELFKAY